MDVNHSDSYAVTAVLNAAKDGNLNLLKLLKASGANIHAQNESGDNSIMSAALGTGDCDTVRWLIEQGVDVNYCDKEGCTAVYCAAGAGNLDVLKLLKERGANIHVQCEMGDNSIMSASIGTGDCNTVRWLIEQGVDVNHCDKEGFTAVLNAAQQGNLDVLKLLKESGADIHVQNEMGRNSIMSAAIGTGDCNTVRWLIEQGVDVNHCDKKGVTAVLNAAQQGNLDVLKLLKESGATIHVQNEMGDNSIMSAAIGTGDCNTVRWLIEQGVDVNHCDKKGFTAVHNAAQQGNLDVLKLLKESGANIHVQCEMGDNSIMSTSIGTGDCNTVRWLIEQGVDVNHCDKKGWTAVHNAAKQGNLDVLKLLKESGADIHVQCEMGDNSIMSAAIGTGDCNTVRWLIEQGVDVNHCDKEGFTAVLNAAQQGNLDVLKLLKESGATIHVQNEMGRNSIMSAAIGTGDCDTVRWLIEQGVDVNHCDKEGFTAVLNAAQQGNLDVLKLLKESGATIHVQNEMGRNSIMSAAIGTGDCNTVRWLIEQGVDVNHCDKKGVTAVLNAAQQGNLDVLKLLKESGATIHVQNEMGRNSIMSASIGTGDCNTVRWLIEQGVDVNHCDKKGWTAVHNAAQQGNLDVLKLLKESGADIHVQNEMGDNSIMSASIGTGDCNTVRWLIEQRVDVNHCDKEGFTAVHNAAQQGNLDVLKLLKERGANIHVQCEMGDNSIMSASIGTGDCNTVRWLIEQGVDVNHCDKKGWTAVHNAAKQGNLDVLKLLKESGADIHVQNEMGDNSIMSASIGTGDCNTVRWLIEQRVDVNHCDKEGFTAVLNAAQQGNLDVLKLLKESGATIHVQNEMGRNSIMSAAIGTGDCDTVRWLIEQGVDVNHCDKEGFTAVLNAAQQGNLDVLKLLKESGANIHVQNEMGRNSIMSAAIGTGDCNTVRWLIEQRVDVNHCDKEGFTAVLNAAQQGNLDVLKLLKESGANIHVQNEMGRNSIMSAAIGTGDCNTVRWLIEQRVDVNHCDKEGFTAVLNAAQQGNLDVLKLLKESGATIHVQNEMGRNSIMSAAIGTGDCNTVRWLIEQGVDVNHCDKKGVTAVLNAAQQGNLDVLKLLKESGATIHVQNEMGRNSIMSAAIGTGDCNTVRWLIEQRVDVNDCDKKGFTAVLNAAQQGNLNVLKLLKESGANIHVQNEMGRNSIMSAAIGTGDCNTVRWLIEQRVDVNHCDKEGFTAVLNAAQQGNLDVLKLLKESGATIHVQNEMGRNSIMSAAIGTGDCDTVRWLIEQGVDVNHCDKEGFTAVLNAAQQGNLDVLKLLKESGANIHVQNEMGRNSIMSAAIGTGDCNTVRWLIEQRVDVNHCDKEGFTAVLNAAQQGNLDVLKLLKESGANIHAQTKMGENSIMAASGGTGDYNTMRWLIEQGIDVNHRNERGATAVHCASQRGNLDVLKFLKGICTNIDAKKVVISATPPSIFCQNFDLECVDKNGSNALIWGICDQGEIELVRSLLEEGLDINSSNAKKITAFHCAAFKHKLVILKELHKKGADINALDKYHRNALHFAVLGGSCAKTVKWLIEIKVDVMLTDEEGLSVLHYTARNKQTDVLELIAKYDKRVSLATNSG